MDFKINKIIYIIVFALPGLAFLTVYIIYPLIMDIVTSFTNWSPTSFNFVGLSNYLFMIKDPLFIRSFITNLIWLGINVPVSVILGLLLALLLTNPDVKLTSLWRTLIFVALTIPPAVAAFMFGYLIFASGTGIVTTVLFHNELNTYGLYWPGLLMMIIITIWSSTAMATVIYTAGAYMLPREIIESSQIDGAGPFTRLFRIYIPLLKPAHIVAITMIAIITLKVFDIVYTLRAPGGASVMLYYMFGVMSYGDYGYANAIVTVMAVLVLVMSIPLAVYTLRGGRR